MALDAIDKLTEDLDGLEANASKEAQEKAEAEERVIAAARDKAVEVTLSSHKISLPAAKFAVDHGIDPKGIRGTSAEGKINVGDIEKVYKAQLNAADEQADEQGKGEREVAEARASEGVSIVDGAPTTAVDAATHEAEATTDATLITPDLQATPPIMPITDPLAALAIYPHQKKTRRERDLMIEGLSLAERGVLTKNVLPTLRTGPRMAEFYHAVRPLSEQSTGGWESGAGVTAAEANQVFENLLNDEWVLVHIQLLHVDAEGIHMLWIFGRPAEEDDEAWPYREIKHISRRIVAGRDAAAVAGGALTQFMANAFVEREIEDGYDLAYVTSLGHSARGGVNMLYVFIR